MITIDQPAMTLNSKVTPPIARYQMWNSWDIDGTHTIAHIVAWVATVARGAPGGKLKNLVIQCHGSPGYIYLGTGSFNRTNVSTMNSWAGLIEKIWVVACRPAYIDPTCGPTGFCASDGNLLISEMARAAQCYVVASTETQWNIAKTYPFGKIPSYEGLVLSYGPQGNVTWSHRYPSGWQGE
ncbi:MAG: hypothetical protein KDJ54_19270 [Candidatus Competibacteraceae bacterium]|nr:hypothetical protein [Candidatus Competibacteraceae bacterium]